MQYEEILEVSSNSPFRVTAPKQEARSSNLHWDGSQPHCSLTFINAANLPQYVKDDASNLLYSNTDIGVEHTHPAVNKNYKGNLGNGKYDHNYNWWDANKVKQPNQVLGKCALNSLVPCDDNNHGTHTISTTIGGLNLGVSPSTKWIACRNMNQDVGIPKTFCLQFLLALTNLNSKNPKPELHPHVVGNSYGCPTSKCCSRTTFAEVLKTLKVSGIFMYVSAGNDDFNSYSFMLAPPAIDPNILGW